MEKNKKYARYGTVLYFILVCISKTLKFKIVNEEKVDRDENFVYGFWHNKLVIASLCFKTMGNRKTAVLASPSKDGELIAVPLEKMGAEIVRGSSGKDSVKSLLKLINLVKKGHNAGTPVDGPKGPIYKVKPGMLYIAQKSGKKLILVGGAYEKCWTFEKAWDKFQFPKPFSKVACVTGEPMEIPKDADLDEYAKVVEEELHRLDKKAEELLRN